LRPHSVCEGLVENDQDGTEYQGRSDSQAQECVSPFRHSRCAMDVGNDRQSNAGDCENGRTKATAEHQEFHPPWRSGGICELGIYVKQQAGGDDESIADH
jgi:hypothetical protein